MRGALAGAALGAVAPYVFVPKIGKAQSSIRGTVKHLLYIRLASGFRFPVAFNSAVAEEFNPFGVASGVPSGVDWGVGNLLTRAPYLDGDAGQAPVLRPGG